MADIKQPLTPEQALEKFDKEIESRRTAFEYSVNQIRADLLANTTAAKDVVENMPPLLAKSLAFLAKDFYLDTSRKGRWAVSAQVEGHSGYGDRTSVREQTVNEVDLPKGHYRAIFVLYPTD